MCNKVSLVILNEVKNLNQERDPSASPQDDSYELGYNNYVAYAVYILRTSSNTLYTGQTNNLEKRLKQHKSKTNKSAKYLRSFKSFELVYQETQLTLSQALKREIEIKKLTHAQKEALINGTN